MFAGRSAETDVSPGTWIADAVHPFAEQAVASLVPPVFAAYARVFHPAVRYAGDDDVHVPWAEVAAANRTVAHPAMEWGSITGSMDYFGEDNQTPLWDDAPARGHLPERLARRLAAVLRRHTTTPDDCLLGVSADFGFLPGGTPTVPCSPGHRLHALVRGPVELAAANMADEPWEQSAGIWWPADRAWLVATDIDLVTTYVGGSRACVDAVLAADGLEAAEVSPTQSVAWDADTINPLPAR
ncbi:hypothetical protein ACI789_10710 [Geodermatophilus sp. SYSU D00965]